VGRPLGRLLYTLPRQLGAIYSVAFAPDGQTLATSGVGQSIWLWHAETGAARGSLSDRFFGGTCLAWLPDGRSLVSGMFDGSLVMWDVPARRPRGAYHSQGNPVFSLALSPSGYLLACGRQQPEVRLWQVEVQQSQGMPSVATPHVTSMPTVRH